MGYAACFDSPMNHVAPTLDIKPSKSSTSVAVGIGQKPDGAFSLDLDITITVEGVSEADARKLIEKAHEVCPYSNAVRGNVDVRALPAYLFCYGDKQILTTGVLDFTDFVAIIAQISDGKITPNLPTLNKSTLQNFLAKRPLISLTEIRYTFNLTDKQTVLDWLNQVQNEWRWIDEEFVEKCGMKKPTKFVHTQTPCVAMWTSFTGEFNSVF